MCKRGGAILAYCRQLRCGCMDQAFAVSHVCRKYLTNGKMYFGSQRIGKGIYYD